MTTPYEPATYLSDLFSWTADSGTTFASDLGPLRDGYPWLATRKLIIESSRTLARCEFRLAAVRRDAEGDIEFWSFDPVDPVTAKGVKHIRIYND